MKINHTRIPLVMALLAVALLGCVLVLVSTRWGPWSIEDTVDYFDVAQNFAAGHGLVMSRPSGNFQPLHIHPPFYSMVLALPAALGLELLTVSRWFNALLFAATIFILSRDALRLTRSPAFSIGIGLLLATSPALVYDFSGAMSEGLFFFLGACSLVLLAARLSRGWSTILAAALLAGLALLTRFSGAAFIVSGAVFLLIWGGSGWKQRLGRTLVYGMVAALPFALWTLSVRLLYPGVNPGYYDLHPTGIWDLIGPVRAALVNGTWTWLGLQQVLPGLPYAFKLVTLGLLLCITFGAAAFSLKHQPEPRTGLIQAFIITAVFTLTSALIVVLGYLFVVIPKPALYERIWSPFEIGLLLCLALAALIIAAPVRRFGWVIPTLIIGFLVLTQTPRLISTVDRLNTEGEGFTSRAWLTSPAIAAVRELPDGIPIISNMPAPIFFLTGQQSRDVVASLTSSGPNPLTVRYGDFLEDPNQVIFREQGAVLVLFKGLIESQLNNIYPQASEAPLDALTRGLYLYSDTADAWIYRYAR